MENILFPYLFQVLPKIIVAADYSLNDTLINRIKNYKFQLKQEMEL